MLDKVDVDRVRVVAGRRRGRVVGRDGDGVSMSDRTALDSTAGVLGERVKTSDGESDSSTTALVAIFGALAGIILLGSTIMALVFVFRLMQIGFAQEWQLTG